MPRFWNYRGEKVFGKQSLIIKLGFLMGTWVLRGWGSVLRVNQVQSPTIITFVLKDILYFALACSMAPTNYQQWGSLRKRLYYTHVQWKWCTISQNLSYIKKEWGKARKNPVDMDWNGIIIMGTWFLGRGREGMRQRGKGKGEEREKGRQRGKGVRKGEGREKLCAPKHTPTFPHCKQKGPEAEAPQEQWVYLAPKPCY